MKDERLSLAFTVDRRTALHLPFFLSSHLSLPSSTPLQHIKSTSLAAISTLHAIPYLLDFKKLARMIYHILLIPPLLILAVFEVSSSFAFQIMLPLRSSWRHKHKASVKAEFVVGTALASRDWIDDVETSIEVDADFSPDMKYVPRNVMRQQRHYAAIRDAGGPTNDVYIREPDSECYWFVGKVARISDVSFPEAVSRQWSLIEMHGAQLRPIELFPARGSLEIWTAPGDSEMQVAYNDPELVFMPMQRKVDGADKIKNSYVGFQPEVYQGGEEGFRTWRTPDGRAAKPEIKSAITTSESSVNTSPNQDDVSLKISTEPKTADIIDQSTMTLLEHVNLNVPTHEYILPFYYKILGFGLDPRKAANLRPEETGKKTLWANCGASQFHLPYGKEAQTIPGHIGLQYPDEESLVAMEERLQRNPNAFGRYEKSTDPRTGKDCLVVVDKYGNQFYCRVAKSRINPSWKQPVIGTSKEDIEVWGQDLVNEYGRSKVECSGIAYVEFLCPTGTAEKIALFYDSVFDATTSVVQDGSSTVAVIGFGNVNSEGLADQALLFRETSDSIPPYDGHHVAMYVGRSADDFEVAFKNTELAGVVWVNPRFSDKADTLEGARKWKQFRFKDIVDMDSGKPIFELEHEIRSVEHEAWPGDSLADQYHCDH